MSESLQVCRVTTCLPINAIHNQLIMLYNTSNLQRYQSTNQVATQYQLMIHQQKDSN